MHLPTIELSNFETVVDREERVKRDSSACRNTPDEEILVQLEIPLELKITSIDKAVAKLW